MLFLKCVMYEPCRFISPSPVPAYPPPAIVTPPALQAFVDIRNLSELLNESPDIVDVPDALDLPTTPKNVGMSLEFRDVWFWYPSQPRSVGRSVCRSVCLYSVRLPVCRCVAWSARLCVGVCVDW